MWDIPRFPVALWQSGYAIISSTATQRMQRYYCQNPTKKKENWQLSGIL
jgi:hypothetical protein